MLLFFGITSLQDAVILFPVDLEDTAADIVLLCMPFFTALHTTYFDTVILANDPCHLVKSDA